MPKNHFCDLVLEGGGVKGLGLVGAVTALQSHNYSFQRIAGTSAGAVVGCLAAAGMDAGALHATMQRLDYTKFQDKTLLDYFGVPGEILSLFLYRGVFKADYAYRFVREELEKLGVRTFKDLRLTDDWAGKLPKAQRYKLVVIASDVSRGQLVRLPWDYHRYGLDPDEQLVADAVRASMSIPFFFIPKKLRRSVLVDGGFLSDFPVSIFDGATEARWPTFGIKLSGKPDLNRTIHPTRTTWELATALFSTMQQAHDMLHLEDPAVVKRTIFVDSGKIKPTDFGITRAQQTRLFNTGSAAAEKFLAHWDFARYKKMGATAEL
jgi:NTE family protein